MKAGADMPQDWLKKRLSFDANAPMVKAVLAETGARTVCEAALCPNLNECFSRSYATFLILGDACTRRCGFCNVEKSCPCSIDPAEPERICNAASRLRLRYAVITSVTRDDLADGGASQFARTVAMLKTARPGMAVEVLVPDFRGIEQSIRIVMEAGPGIFGHNIETVRRLYEKIRPGASYERSLDVLRSAKRMFSGIITKSGMMVGLGESREEVLDTMEDLRKAGCDIITIGQYLRPSSENLPVMRLADPEEFAGYMDTGKRLGFKHVAAGTFVRSSYFAEEAYRMIKEEYNAGCETAAIG